MGLFGLTQQTEFEKFQTDVNGRIRDLEDKMKVLKDELSAALRNEAVSLSDRLAQMERTITNMNQTRTQGLTADDYQRQFGNKLVSDMNAVKNEQVALGVRVTNINSRIDELKSQIEALSAGKPKPQAEPVDARRDNVRKQIEKIDKDISVQKQRINDDDAKIQKAKNNILAIKSTKKSSYVANMGSMPLGMAPMSLATTKPTSRPSRATTGGPTPEVFGTPTTETKDLDAQGVDEKEKPGFLARLRGDAKKPKKPKTQLDNSRDQDDRIQQDISREERNIKNAEDDKSEAIKTIMALQRKREALEKSLLSLGGSGAVYSGYSWVPLEAMGL